MPLRGATTEGVLRQLFEHDQAGRRTAVEAPAAFDRTEWAALLRGWGRSLGTKAPRTQALYLGAGGQFVDHLEATAGPQRAADLDRATMEEF